jgi:LysM repeat protein
VAAFEHTMILIGYDKKNVHLVDAFTGLTVTHSLENFLESWSVLGNMAIVGNGIKVEEVQTELIQKEEVNTYAVRSGDTLGKLATAWSVPWQEIAATNQITYPYVLNIGQELIIQELDAEPEKVDPTPSEINQRSSETYIVQPQEHLMKIARNLEIDWQILAEINDLESPYLLYPGDELFLPTDGEASIPEPESSQDDAVPQSYSATQTESIFSIAHRFELSWSALAAKNYISFPYIVYSGQILNLD